MVHGPHYRASVDLQMTGLHVGRVAHPEYPIAAFSNHEYLVVLEGRVSGQRAIALATELTELADKVVHGGPEAQLAARRWIAGHDGDYLVMFATRDGKKIAVFADALGRLPIYLSVGRAGVVVARECKFILTIMGGAAFDRLGCAQYLWFGYPLGQRTLFDGVSRAPAGFLLHAQVAGSEIHSEMTEVMEWDFDEQDETRPLAKQAARLSEAFCDSVSQDSKSLDPAPVVLALSGGHDSRSVAAALKAAGVSFRAATFRRSGGQDEADSSLAAEIAKQMGIDWQLYELDEADLEDELRLVRMKDGMNYAGMAFILQFLDQLASQWSRGATYVTGDFGDSLLKDRRPRPAPTQPDGLLDAVIEEHAIVRSDVAEAVMRVEPGRLREELAAQLGKYSETGVVRKAIRFRMFERGRKWYFEGEDRNRFSLCQWSPFASFSFTRLAMRVPDRFKAHFALYREFQRRLDPMLIWVPTPDINLPLSSPMFTWKRRAFDVGQRLPTWLKSRIKDLMSAKRERSFRCADGPGAPGESRSPRDSF